MNSRLIFISYARDDGLDFPRELRTRITDDTALRAFLDDSDIQKAKPWEKQIDKAIEDSFALIVVIGEKANDSMWVTYEWAFAVGLGKPIFVLIRSKEARDKMHDKLHTYQHYELDFVSPTEEKWVDLLQNLEVLHKETEIPSGIEKAIDLAEDPRLDYRKQAIQVLETAKHEAATDGLIGLCDSIFPDTKIRASIALARRLEDEKAIKGEIAIEGLEQGLCEFEFKDVTLGLLSEYKTPAAAAALHRGYNYCQNYRDKILLAMTRFPDSSIIPYLRELWHETHKYFVLHSLIGFGDEEVLPEVERILLSDEERRKDNFDNRRTIIRHLDKYDSETVLPLMQQLIEFLNRHQYQEDDELMKTTLETLERIGGQAALDILPSNGYYFRLFADTKGKINLKMITNK